MNYFVSSKMVSFIAAASNNVRDECVFLELLDGADFGKIAAEHSLGEFSLNGTPGQHHDRG